MEQILIDYITTNFAKITNDPILKEVDIRLIDNIQMKVRSGQDSCTLVAFIHSHSYICGLMGLSKFCGSA